MIIEIFKLGFGLGGRFVSLWVVDFVCVVEVFWLFVIYVIVVIDYLDGI